MITSITIPPNQASYGPGPHILDDLTANVFIYGANGSGKTTISRLLQNESTTAASWQNSRPLRCDVYNSDWIEHNLHRSDSFPGIFTLGEESEQLQRDIQAEEVKEAKAKDRIDSAQRRLDGDDDNRGLLKEREEDLGRFTELCWSLKAPHKEYFKVALKGYLNDKSRYCDEMKRRLHQAAPSNAIALADLQEQAKILFDKKPDPVRICPALLDAYDDLETLAKAEIFAKPIIAAADVSLAPLIKQLSNSNWVDQGRGFIATSGNRCPFCQQDLKPDFSMELEKLFDLRFEEEVRQFQDAHKTYIARAIALCRDIQDRIDGNYPHMDGERLAERYQALKDRLGDNRQRLEGKEADRGRRIELLSVTDLIEGIRTLCFGAKSKGEAHNNTVREFEQKQETLKQAVWNYFCSEARPHFEAFSQKISLLDKQIAGLQQNITQHNGFLKLATQAKQDLEKRSTNTKATEVAINQLLEHYGFTGFCLDSEANGLHYHLRRPCGSAAKDTLSEGEKTFIAFLYFYHSLMGNITAQDIKEDRVVVLDDPISSLDAEVLFIVSRLIMKLQEQARVGDSTIKQVIILTHNVYFHKEVSFWRGDREEAKRKQRFFTVSKASGQSVVRAHPHNPITSSYGLLWDEVRQCLDDPDAIRPPSLQNVLRRILESYFKMLGGVDPRDVIEQDDLLHEDPCCQALLSWVNAGSHGCDDDAFIRPDTEAVAKQLDVFRRIFVKSGHEAHYRMMLHPKGERIHYNPVGEMAS